MQTDQEVGDGMIHRWTEEPCFVCQTTIVLCRDGHIPTCADCWEEYYENLASVIDPSYDKKKMNDFVDVWKILGRLWMDWEPQWRHTGEYLVSRKGRERRVEIDSVKGRWWDEGSAEMYEGEDYGKVVERDRGRETDEWGIPKV